MAKCELCKLVVTEVREFGKYGIRICRKCVDNEPFINRYLDWY